jgi:hypothetical protein
LTCKRQPAKQHHGAQPQQLDSPSPQAHPEATAPKFDPGQIRLAVKLVERDDGQQDAPDRRNPGSSEKSSSDGPTPTLRPSDPIPVAPQPRSDSSAAAPPAQLATPLKNLQHAIDYASLSRNADGLAEFVARFSAPGIAGLKVSLSALREGGVGLRLNGSRNLTPEELDELLNGLPERGIRRVDLRD